MCVCAACSKRIKKISTSCGNKEWKWRCGWKWNSVKGENEMVKVGGLAMFPFSIVIIDGNKP